MMKLMPSSWTCRKVEFSPLFWGSDLRAQKIFQQIWGNSFFWGGEGSVSLMFCTYFWSAEVAKVFIPCDLYDKTICLRIGLKQILGQDMGQSVECNV